MNVMPPHKMPLPHGVQAYALLTCANLSPEQEQLCRATCVKLDYSNMKQQIQKVTFSSATSSSYPETFAPTQYVGQHQEDYYEEYYEDDETEEAEGIGHDEPEETFLTDPTSQRTTGAGAYGGGRPNPRPKRSVNPPDEFGNPQVCRYCKSIYHWINNCPDAPDSAKYGGRGRGRSRGYRPRGSYAPRGAPPRRGYQRQF